MKYFDINFLHDLHAYNQRELGLCQLKILTFFIDKKEQIIVERRAGNAPPEVLHVLDNNNFQDFFNHWSNLFNN